MTHAATTKSEPSKTEAKKSPQRQRFFPWRYCLVAAFAISLLAYYVTRVAPGLPLNPDPPFPVLAQAIEDACFWCGENQGYTFAIAAGLLVPGIILFRVSAKRYYVFLTLMAILTLGITYYFVSAPIERLFQSVKDSIPKDHRVDTNWKK